MPLWGARTAEPVEKTKADGGAATGKWSWKSLLRRPVPEVKDLRRDESRKEEDSLHNLARYSQARKIADLLFECVKTDGGKRVLMKDARTGGCADIFPQHQTHRGLFLEVRGGVPNRLWTPWGEYRFGGAGRKWDDAMLDSVLERLGATVFADPGANNGAGETGQIYALHKLDKEPLPDPVLREGFGRSHLDCESAWGRLGVLYSERHPGAQAGAGKPGPRARKRRGDRLTQQEVEHRLYSPALAARVLQSGK